MMNGMLAMTVQEAVGSIGPLPDNCGDDVKEIISRDDELAKISLGLAIEDSMKVGNYVPLHEFIEKIRNRVPWLPVEKPEIKEDLECPFCQEMDFDKEGLKYHIKNHCEDYQKVEDI